MFLCDIADMTEFVPFCAVGVAVDGVPFDDSSIWLRSCSCSLLWGMASPVWLNLLLVGWDLSLASGHH